jgi:hypothetical protein
MKPTKFRVTQLTDQMAHDVSMPINLLSNDDLAQLFYEVLAAIGERDYCIFKGKE